MCELAAGAVDENSPYSYLMMCEYFTATCAVATVGSRVVGFTTGFRLPEDPETLFVWQIVADESVRGQGVAARMLNHLVDRPVVPRVRFLEATVTPDNEPSLRLFRRFAESRDAECVEETLFGTDVFPNGHDPELRIRSGPF